MSYPKRTAALASVAALAGSAVLTAAPAAQAQVVDVNYQCKTPIGDKSAVSPIDIKGVKSGSGYRITMTGLTDWYQETGNSQPKIVLSAEESANRDTVEPPWS